MKISSRGERGEWVSLTFRFKTDFQRIRKYCRKQRSESRKMLLMVPDASSTQVGGWQEFCWFLQRAAHDEAHAATMGAGGRIIRPFASLLPSKSHANTSCWQNANHSQDPGFYIVSNLPAS